MLMHNRQAALIGAVAEGKGISDSGPYDYWDYLEKRHRSTPAHLGTPSECPPAALRRWKSRARRWAAPRCV